VTELERIDSFTSARPSTAAAMTSPHVDVSREIEKHEEHARKQRELSSTTLLDLDDGRDTLLRPSTSKPRAPFSPPVGKSQRRSYPFTATSSTPLATPERPARATTQSPDGQVRGVSLGHNVLSEIQAMMQEALQAKNLAQEKLLQEYQELQQQHAIESERAQAVQHHLQARIYDLEARNAHLHEALEGEQKNRSDTLAENKNLEARLSAIYHVLGCLQLTWVLDELPSEDCDPRLAFFSTTNTTSNGVGHADPDGRYFRESDELRSDIHVNGTLERATIGMLPRVLLAAEMELAKSEEKLEKLKMVYEQEIKELQADYIMMQHELSESEIHRVRTEGQVDRLRLERLRLQKRLESLHGHTVDRRSKTSGEGSETMTSAVSASPGSTAISNRKVSSRVYSDNDSASNGDVMYSCDTASTRRGQPDTAMEELKAALEAVDEACAAAELRSMSNRDMPLLGSELASEVSQD